MIAYKQSCKPFTAITQCSTIQAQLQQNRKVLRPYCSIQMISRSLQLYSFCDCGSCPSIKPRCLWRAWLIAFAPSPPLPISSAIEDFLHCCAILHMMLPLQTTRARVGESGSLPNASILGCIRNMIRQQGWVGLWRGNTAQVLKRVLTALVSWMTERIAIVLLEYTLAAISVKISFSESDGSKSKAPVLELAMLTLTDVLFIGLLYPFEYLHNMLASGALCGTSSTLH
jgi:hypothetical protein